MSWILFDTNEECAKDHTSSTVFCNRRSPMYLSSRQCLVFAVTCVLDLLRVVIYQSERLRHILYVIKHLECRLLWQAYPESILLERFI